jgi:hypothetical protein
VPRRRLLTGILLAAAFAGCGAQGGGGGNFEGEEQRDADAVADFQTAAQEDDPRKICGALLDDALVKRLNEQPGGCERVVGKALDQADNYQLDVKDVAIRGTTATVRVEAGTKDEQERLTLVKRGKDWQISSLGGAR